MRSMVGGDAEQSTCGLDGASWCQAFAIPVLGTRPDCLEGVDRAWLHHGALDFADVRHTIFREQTEPRTRQMGAAGIADEHVHPRDEAAIEEAGDCRGELGFIEEVADR